MNYTLFIDCQYIKNNTPIIAYVSDDELQPFIKVAQDIHLQRILGTNLFKDLQSKIQSNTLSIPERTLIEEYIQPSTSYWTVYEYILFSHYKMTNKGINKQFSDNSKEADFTEVNFLRNAPRDTAEYFSQRLTKYLIANTSLFPLYYGGIIDPSTIVPKKNNYFSGLYTGKNSKGCIDCPNEVSDSTFTRLR